VKFEKNSKTTFFDLETTALEKKATKSLALTDSIRALYFQKFQGRDFGYMTKGIQYNKQTGEGPELMFVGDITLNSNRFVMTNPSMVIGTDRMELYEFFGRRREVLQNRNQQLIKLMIGVTLAHMVVV